MKADEAVVPYGCPSSLEQAAVASCRDSHRMLSGEEVRHLRDRHGMTAAEFARLLRVAAGTIAAWEQIPIPTALCFAASSPSLAAGQREAPEQV